MLTLKQTFRICFFAVLFAPSAGRAESVDMVKQQHASGVLADSLSTHPAAQKFAELAKNHPKVVIELVIATAGEDVVCRGMMKALAGNKANNTTTPDACITPKELEEFLTAAKAIHEVIHNHFGSTAEIITSKNTQN